MLALAVTGLVVGCKTDPDEALVIFKVMVDEHVPPSATIHFAVDGRQDDKIHKKNGDRTFQFGYYLSGVSGKVTIRGRALDQQNCVVGDGMLDVTGVVPGQRTFADGTLPITAKDIRVCSDAGAGGGGDGSAGADASDAGLSDARQGNEDGPSIVVTGKQAPGKACNAAADCESGYCADGMCCDHACTETCKACAATYTGGMDGVCGNVTAGASARGACTNETATNPCGHDGTCDGNGACRNVTAGQTCGQAMCMDAKTFQPMETCDGAGTCTTPPKVNCGNYPCATTGCALPCTADANCGTGQYCTNGTCKVKKANGTGCAATSECSSGFCSPDLVCCDKACTGPCTACLKASTGQTDGTCAPVQLGQDPHNDCTMEAYSTCGKDGACDGKGACHFYASGTSCGAGSCTGTLFTPGKICNGTGMCVSSGAAVNCGAYICTAGGCGSACSVDVTCTLSSYCDKMTSKCTAKKSNGATCALGNECTTGSCVDGVCCNTDCTGKCVASNGCSTTGTGGTAGTGGMMGSAGSAGTAGTSGTTPTFDMPLRLEDPCGAIQSSSICLHQGKTSDDGLPFSKNTSVTMGGIAGTLYQVKIRIRGIVEPTTITGGTVGTPSQFVTAGTAGPDMGNSGNGAYNQWRLTTTVPSQSYYLNAYPSVTHSIYALDYMETITIGGGSTVKLDEHDANAHFVTNTSGAGGGPVATPMGVQPLAGNNVGQFVQIDVVP